MAEYSLREVVQLAGLSRHIVRRLVQEGVVTPERARNREYRFSFQDLIVLRTARSLHAANIAPRRILRSLKRLRTLLPATMPMCGLRVSALGADVVVHESDRRWEASSGQMLLDFDLRTDSGTPRLIERHAAQPSDAETHFEDACGLEDDEPESACEHYRQAIAYDPAHLSAYINLGCLLHDLQRMDEAEAVYQQGLAACEDKSVLWFNLGVLREDLGRIAEAVHAYHSALRSDPELADAHYNIARLYAALGRSQDAVRAYNDYRRLQKEAPQ
jgi:DNA-binding transcriptional MerR regulator